VKREVNIRLRCGREESLIIGGIEDEAVNTRFRLIVGQGLMTFQVMRVRCDPEILENMRVSVYR